MEMEKKFLIFPSLKLLIRIEFWLLFSPSRIKICFVLFIDASIEISQILISYDENFFFIYKQGKQFFISHKLSLISISLFDFW